MTDEQKPVGSTQAGNTGAKNMEASATDLLSLWGSSSTAKPTVQMGHIPAQQILPKAPVEPPPPPESAPLSHQQSNPPIQEQRSNLPIQPKPEQKPPAMPTPEPAPVITQEKPAFEETPVHHKPKHKQKTHLESELPPENPMPTTMAPKKPENEIPKPHIQQKPQKREEAIEGEIISSKPAPEKEAPFVKNNETKITDEFKEEEISGSPMDEFLEELHISRRQIFYGVGCIILIIVLIIGGIFGYRYFTNSKKSTVPAPIINVKSPTVITKEDTGIPSSKLVGDVNTVPLKYVGDTGIEASIPIGIELIGEQGLAKPILLLRRIQNAYATDIDGLLLESTDRQARLDSHLALLRELDKQGKEVSDKLKMESDILQAEYQKQSDKQTVYDTNYFEQLKTLNAQTTEDILGDFIQISKKIVELRSRFKAVQKVYGMYGTALPRLEGLIKDIELNEESLVAGIKIYKVQGSKLNLIVPVTEDQSNLTSGSNDGFNTPASPLLPIHPSQVKTSKDYITQPGGGI